MAEDLYPIPFSTLVGRLRREIATSQDKNGAIYNLPKRQWWTPREDLSLQFSHFGMSMGTPVGPASGPHTQLAQNLVLSWLAGSRFMELKTVQILDNLEIPRPCIHVPHIGYNVEWSQELKVPQSAREYAKGWFLIHLLASKVGPGLWPAAETVFDISVGYDLKGIQSEKVARYIKTMLDAQELLDSLRQELPEDLRAWADIAVPSKISRSVTISTFHGCPADEIEAIAAYLMEEYQLHTVIKLNPTLLGYERVCDIVQKRLGYDMVELSPEPFEKDLKWAQMMDMLPRLQKIADEQNVGFGVKFSNTLVMKSPEPPFAEGGEMYLSGPPLHVLALTLAKEFSDATGGNIPITFSAGIDAQNFAGVFASGIAPITTCSDLLKVRGYGRLPKYLQNLEADMKKHGAKDLDAYRAAVGGKDDPKEASAITLSNLTEQLLDDVRYHREKNKKPPKKVGTELDIFDCLTCDKCVPVCPNAANFTFPVPLGEHTPGKVQFDGNSWEESEGETLQVVRKHQIGNTVEACNLCGHCDTWCPEDGGPYLTKPNLFILKEAFEGHPERDGFHLSEDRRSIAWRRRGQLYQLASENDRRYRFELPNGGRIWLEDDKPVQTEGKGDADLTIAVSMRLILDGLTAPEAQTWLA